MTVFEELLESVAELFRVTDKVLFPLFQSQALLLSRNVDEDPVDAVEELFDGTRYGLDRLQKGLTIIDLARNFGEDFFESHGSHVEFEEWSLGPCKRELFHLARDRDQLQESLVHVDTRLEIRLAQHAHDEVERDGRVDLIGLGKGSS